MTTIAVSIKSAADMVGVSQEIIRVAINRGELPAKRIPPIRKGALPTAIRVDVAALEEWFRTLEDARS